VQRACDNCAVDYEAKRPASRFCSSACRTAWSRRPKTAATGKVPKAAPQRSASTKVADALRRELEQLGVADLYEGAVAVGIAGQLDSGTVVGAAYASLSKELDRRVDALRMRADRPDDPAQAVVDRFEDKRQSLRLA
jgi:hypothetical protein